MVGAALETDAIVAGEGRGGISRGDVLGEARCLGQQDQRAEKGFAGTLRRLSGTASSAPAGKDRSEFSAAKSAAMLQLTKSRSQDQKALATFDKRVDDQTQLAGVYGKWIGIVAGKQRAVLNHALRGIAIILVIALIGLFFEGWIERLLGKMSMDRRQVETLRTVTRVTCADRRGAFHPSGNFWATHAARNYSWDWRARDLPWH